nr:hypothetical protein [Actinomycetota bacterium]
MQRWRLIAFISACLLAAAVGTATADTTAFSDRKETGSRLDFSKIVQGHSGDEVRHQLTMHQRWGRKHLRNRNNFIDFAFNTDDDSQYDRALRIDYDPNGGLRGEMSVWDSGEVVGEVSLVRKNRRTIEAIFPMEMLGENVGTYEWIVGSLYHAPGYGPCGILS